MQVFIPATALLGVQHGSYPLHIAVLPTRAKQTNTRELRQNRLLIGA